MKSYKKNFGNINENIVSNYLKSNNYVLIDTNCKHHLGEIDIIALDKLSDCICFIEVKSRFFDNFDVYTPITKKQINRIKRSASVYLNKHFPNKNARIDLIKVINNDASISLDHIKNITW